MRAVVHRDGARRGDRIASRPRLAIVFMLALSACTVAKPVHFSAPADLARAVRPGESIRVTTKTGKVSELTVVTVDEVEIRGTKESIRNDSIARVELIEHDTGQTATYVWGGVGIAACIILLVVLI